jgi:formate dehydrogenase alpha subunit
MTILDLAREVGVKIPTLCDDPTLKPIGACRMCLVEEEKSQRLLASCVTPITAGMVINTESPAVIENRRVIVKLMLTSHPESCLLCEKGNRCRLRLIAAELGIGTLNYYPTPHFTGTQELNPFISRDLSKCILCSKCIRADHELVVVGALDYMHRGFDAIPATTFNGPLESSECTFCGTCVTMCPTGALFEKGKPHLGTLRTRTASICSYCGCGCNIFLEADAGRLVSVSPNPDNDLNGKTLCVRGHYGSDYIHHADRLRKPLIRKDGILQEAGWDEALDFVAEGLKSCYSRYGPDAMAFFGSSKCTNEDNFVFQKFARTVFQSNNIDNGARLYSGASLDSLPFGAMTNPLSDLEESDVIVVVGSNPTASHPIAGYRIKRAVRHRGSKLIVLDPRRSDLVSFATAWAPVLPGKDHILINGIMRGLLDLQAQDDTFLQEQTVGLPVLRDSLSLFSDRYVTKTSGCPSSTFESILNLLAEAQRPAIVYGHAITRQQFARQTIGALVNLVLLKGSLGKTGGGIYPLDKENNGQGAWDMGLMPNHLPGYQGLTDDRSVQRFETRWNRTIPRKQGMSALQMIRKAETRGVKAMYVMGENPTRAFGDSPRVEKALSALDFLVVQDLFLTETAKLAHAVFPACSFAEKDGTFTNIERRIQSIRKAIDPIGQSQPDWRILCLLSQRLGYPMEYASSDEIMEEIASLVPIYSGVSRENVAGGRTFWPCTKPGFTGEVRLSVSGWGKTKALLVPTRLSTSQNGGIGPFILLRGSTFCHFLTGTRSTRSARLAAMNPPGTIEMNPVDAREFDLKEGDPIKIHNSMAEVTMTLKTSESLPRGMIFSPYSDRSLSPLLSFAFDHTEQDVCRVYVKKED